MDSYREIEIKIAERHGTAAKGAKKSIGDFLLNNNIKQPVNVKSNNLDKKTARQISFPQSDLYYG